MIMQEMDAYKQTMCACYMLHEYEEPRPRGLHPILLQEIGI